MSCEHLICARCAHPVEEGNCPVCRASRARFHHHGPSPQQVMILCALLLLLAFSLALPHLAG
ncbi:hypothetical protein GCM10022221_55580 [Actinocorallia aurea]